MQVYNPFSNFSLLGYGHTVWANLHVRFNFGTFDQQLMVIDAFVQALPWPIWYWCVFASQPCSYKKC